MREEYCVHEGVVEGLEVDVYHGVDVGDGAGGDLELGHFDLI